MAVIDRGQGLCPERLGIECKLCLKCPHQGYSALLGFFKDCIHSSLQIKLTDKELLLFLLTWIRKGPRVMRGPFVRQVHILCAHVFLGSSLASWILWVFTLGELRAAVKQDSDTLNYTKVVGYDIHSKGANKKTYVWVTLLHSYLINYLVRDIIKLICVGASLHCLMSSK